MNSDKQINQTRNDFPAPAKEASEAKKLKAEKVDTAIKERVDELEKICLKRVIHFLDSLGIRTKGAAVIFLNPDHPVWNQIRKQTRVFCEQIPGSPEQERQKLIIQMADKTLDIMKKAATETDDALESRETISA